MALPKVDFTEADVFAVRALLEGTASNAQQLRGMRWIMENVCHVYSSPYIADGSDRDSFVMLGMHRVGVLIGYMTSEQALADAKKPQAPGQGASAKRQR